MRLIRYAAAALLDAGFSGGCWAQLYSGSNFAGDTLTLGSAGDYAYFKDSYAHLARKWDSIEVGPQATLTAYDNVDFTQPVATFKPAQRIADLDDELGFLENIRGIRMRCGK